MDKSNVLEMQLDWFKGTEMAREGLQAHEALEPANAPASSVDKDTTAHMESDMPDKKLQERIERSMDAIKHFIHNIDINSL